MVSRPRCVIWPRCWDFWAKLWSWKLLLPPDSRPLLFFPFEFCSGLSHTRGISEAAVRGSGAGPTKPRGSCRRCTWNHQLLMSFRWGHSLFLLCFGKVCHGLFSYLLVSSSLLSFPVMIRSPCQKLEQHGVGKVETTALKLTAIAAVASVCAGISLSVQKGSTVSGLWHFSCFPITRSFHCLFAATAFPYSVPVL